MNKEWSEKNSQIQKLLGKESSYKDGIDLLIKFRNELFEQITFIVNGFPLEAFSLMPFAGADGYHSKTLAYSIWHIFRIEDIVAHTLIENDEQILFAKDYREKINAEIITTGNELQGEKIEDFSKVLDIKSLYEYAKEVMLSTNDIMLKLDYAQLKRKFSDNDKDRIIASECVSTDENAAWLIDYWCGKDVRGLIKMPFCRHWIMHIEAMQRIKNKLCKLARKGVDPIAYCGFSCNHCFLSQWCGSCRTEYNTCSFATCFPDKKCPNATCCKDKNIDGCYECAELEICQKGFYDPNNDGANAAKAQAMFINKYGKKAFLKVHDKLHEKYSFSKTQEILGQDMHTGLKILEDTYNN
ncbi:MAG: DUF3795 domain-containing protein [Oscillospiraceae bacterium]